MQKLKHRIQFDWHFLVIALSTTMVGSNFILNPGLMDDSSAYAFLVSIVDDTAFAVPVALVGLFGLIAFTAGWVPIRSLLLTVYQFIWVILFLAYLYRAFNGYPNSSWIMALSINLAIFFIALWGDYNEP